MIQTKKVFFIAAVVAHLHADSSLNTTKLGFGILTDISEPALALGIKSGKFDGLFSTGYHSVSQYKSSQTNQPFIVRKHQFYNLGLNYAVSQTPQSNYYLGVHARYSDGTLRLSNIRFKKSIRAAIESHLGNNLHLRVQLDLISQELIHTPYPTEEGEIQHYKSNLSNHWFSTGSLGLIKYISL